MIDQEDGEIERAPKKKVVYRSEMSRPVNHAILGICATLVTAGILATVSLYANVQTLTGSLAATQREQEVTARQLSKHLEHAVDKDDYLRDKAKTDALIGQMATKDDLRSLREMIIDLIGTGNRAAKYRNQ